MKKLFIPILTLSIFSRVTCYAQSTEDILNISLKGDANTEQAAKLELIRILQERLNKLTVAQLNSRIIVSTGVKTYYKVEEIFKMHDQMWAFHGQLTKETNALGSNAGFQQSGFIQTYKVQISETMETASAIRKQTKVLIADGKPIVLPSMPTFSISPASSVDDVVGSFASTMDALFAQYGIKSEGDVDKLPADQKAAFQSAVDAAKADFEKSLKGTFSAQRKSTLTLIGNVAGTLLGVPGAGSIIAGLASGGGAGALSGLVGSIVDKFMIPDDYYDSATLKLTDAERLKMIDELHTRMSETFQKGMALRANMNSEVRKRYDNISQPRNEQILYGPKK